MNYEIRPESGFSDFYYTEYAGSVAYSPHIHSHIEFVYVLEGNLNLNAFCQNLRIPSGSFAVITPYEIHSYYSEADSDIFILACPPEYIPDYKHIFSGKSYEPIYSQIRNDHRAIIKEIINSDFNDNMRKKALIYCTLSDFISGVNFRKKESFEYDLYRKAINYISANYTNDSLTLEKTARQMGVTASHLSRILNSDGKPGFSSLVNSLRAYSAKQMLEQKSMPIAQIALDNGFGSVRNFNRIFKKIYGCTPRESGKI